MCTKLEASHRNWILYGFSSIPVILGASSLLLGTWLSVVVLHNAGVEKDRQIYFEKVTATSILGWDTFDEGKSVRLDNDSPFSHTPVDNLCFYLLALSFVTILGGIGRIITTTFFCLHLYHNRVTGQLFWAWLVLSILAVTIEVLVTFDILNTLSHNNITPPYNSDFFFTNDTYGFYSLCQILRTFIWVDLALSGFSQFFVCWLYRLHVRENRF